MKKFLIIFALLFVVSCGQTSENQTQTGATEVTASGQTFADVLKNSSTKITNTEAFNACMTPQINTCLHTTAVELAKKENNMDFCNELATDSEKNSCRMGAIVSNAKEKSDIASCDIITDQSLILACKTSLIRETAKATQDIAQCDAIKTLYKDSTELAEVTTTTCMMEALLQNPKLQKSDCAVFSKAEDKKTCEDMATIIATYGTATNQ